jgi:hypothetical protein
MKNHRSFCWVHERAVWRRKSNTMQSAYAEIYFQVPIVHERIAAMEKSSVGQNGVSGSDIKAQPLALVPFAEQQEIVRRVGALFAQAEPIQARFDNASGWSRSSRSPSSEKPFAVDSSRRQQNRLGRRRARICRAIAGPCSRRPWSPAGRQQRKPSRKENSSAVDGKSLKYRRTHEFIQRGFFGSLGNSPRRRLR